MINDLCIFEHLKIVVNDIKNCFNFSSWSLTCTTLLYSLTILNMIDRTYSN